jgi:prepilin-type N-terminal cleavage/methylation domain-containing protein
MEKARKRRSRRGFTLVEVMTVMFVMSTMFTIATPGMIRARTKAWRATCVTNLKQMQGAKEQWALQTSASSFSVPHHTDIFGPTLYIRTRPRCPAGGFYWMGAVSEPVGCTRFADGHVLP